jgi:ABC-type bacteriocin/lantibiotic exporter with double-glycine peptidase domain
VAQNLRLVHPLATDEELKWATGMAGILDDIMEMPRGFDTRISDGKADQLPYGFRQRLGLARTYLRPAPVIVFDEPGNGLDNDADMLFQRALNYMRGKATVFIVSHRPSHLKLADVVVLMEDGYVRQVGSYEQVSPLIMKL